MINIKNIIMRIIILTITRNVSPLFAHFVNIQQETLPSPGDEGERGEGKEKGGMEGGSEEREA